MTYKISQGKDLEVCHYFQYIVVTGRSIGKTIFYKEMDFQPKV